MTTYVAKGANGWWKCGHSRDPVGRMTALAATNPPADAMADGAPVLFHVFDVTEPWDAALERTLLETYFVDRSLTDGGRRSEWFCADDVYVRQVCAAVAATIRDHRLAVEAATIDRLPVWALKIARHKTAGLELSPADLARVVTLLRGLGWGDSLGRFAERVSDASELDKRFDRKLDIIDSVARALGVTITPPLRRRAGADAERGAA